MAEQRLIPVGKYLVDIDALLTLSYRCRPERCVHAKTCCSSYDIRVSPKEVSAAVGLLPDAARYAPGLREGRGYIDPIEEHDGGSSFATCSDGTCVYAYRGGDGGVRCALHSAALDLGIAPERAKPASCSLWPLALSEGKPPILTVMADAQRFPCNRRRTAASTLHPGVADLIAGALGPAFLRKLETALTIATMESRG